MLKIYLKSEDRTVCVKDESAITTDDALYLFKDALVALGYHPESVIKSVQMLAEEYDILDKEKENV